ncbi:MAG: hypothetical protein JWR26_3564 [Pedosphaera sp.]|nr:hypothetical protein [Pedosphaera sp.]
MGTVELLRITRKRLLVAALALILIAFTCLLLISGQKPQSLSRAVTLPDGTSVRILAVTFGTNHVVGTTMARMFARWPPVADILSTIPGLHNLGSVHSMTTPTPQFVVWLDQRTNGASAPTPGAVWFTAVLGDGSNFISGADTSLATGNSMSLIYPIQFGAFPRRDRELTLNIFQQDSKAVTRLCNSLSFTSPFAKSYPQWQAESLPATKRAGDLEVTLRNVETGHDFSPSYTPRRGGGNTVTFGTNRFDGRNTTVVYLKLQPLTNSSVIWQVAGVELSDATGNRTSNSSMNGAGGDGSFVFSPSLWPAESAWKLKLEVKKTEGFKPEELFVFKNVPLGELGRTNLIDLATNINGVTVTLQNLCRRAPMTNGSWSSSQLSNFHISLSGLGAGTQLDLLQMVCDTGKTNHASSWTSSGDKRDYGFFEIPLTAQTVDITFALQQSRTVEFTVKPELPKQEANK